MIRLIPTTSAAPSQRWQSRDEILKAHLDSLSPDKLRRKRPDYYWACFGQKAWLAAARKAKFDANQPRVPAGKPNGGQWTSEAGGINDPRVISDATPGNDWIPGAQYAAGPKRSEAYCWNQLTIDNLRCSAVFPAPRRAACRRQATERYANCLTGKDFPPLNF